ncbi:hypothetical protein JAAARDRAFT_533750 [Jaapia argillacea MUCL 33604]|uniref:Uncharacterized protein n=1 Tax=Jaapia argillacea MUCL 33604 TaxID=933084 RepID=A0A067PLP4_9AGAM|nr:hypothetical protein JAAARDRAFT_533750 [Jaapia argillacea MUCL 33604]
MGKIRHIVFFTHFVPPLALPAGVESPLCITSSVCIPHSIVVLAAMLTAPPIPPDNLTMRSLTTSFLASLLSPSSPSPLRLYINLARVGLHDRPPSTSIPSQGWDNRAFFYDAINDLFLFLVHNERFRLTCLLISCLLSSSLHCPRCNNIVS